VAVRFALVEDILRGRWWVVRFGLHKDTVDKRHSQTGFKFKFMSCSHG
jgi:hypothetical protein